MHNKIVILALLAIPLLATAPLAGQDLGVAPPLGHWRTVATPHFTVLYSEGQDSVAQRVANLAETVHARLVPFLRWQPDGTTSVIITDNNDEANALSSPLPHRTIALNLSQPLGESGNYQDWLYEVLVHEYTHILQTDMVDGVPAAIRSVFGRLYVPNFIQPVHQIEGLAVYAETAFTGFGRDRSAYYNGVLRSFVREGKWLPLDRATVFSPYWPPDAPYLFGGKFFEYLAARFRNDRIAQYQRKHSRLAWPFLQNRMAKDVFGAGFKQLWNDWQVSCSRSCLKQIDSISQSGVPAAARLTTNGYDKTSLAASPDGSLLAWIEYNADEYPALKLLDRRTGETTVLRRGYCAGAVSFSPDGEQIVFAQREHARYWEQYYDLYTVEIASRHVRRLTSGRRAHDPAWSPDGATISFVADSLGLNGLATFDIKSRTIKYLTGFDDSRYSHPSYAPDGKCIALSAWCPGGYQDIYVYEFTTAQFTPLLVDRAQDLSPVWSADGRSIVFASDRTGIWNIYAYDLDSTKTLQLTNAVGGAVSPALLGSNDTLCFLDLSSGGFDVASIAASDCAPRPVTPFSDTGRMEIDDIPATAYPSSVYRPWRSLKPYFWFPTGFADERSAALGFFCIGSDALTQLNYQSNIGYNGATGRPAYSVTLSDTRNPLAFAFAFSDMAVAHNVRIAGTDTTYWERRQQQEVGVSYAWRRTSHVLTPAVSYRHQRLAGLNNLMPHGNPFWTGNLSDLRFSLAFSNAQQYGFSISPEHGRQLFAEADIYRAWLGSAITQDVAWGRWREFIGLPFVHHVLLLDGRAGIWRARGLAHFDDNIAFDLRGYEDGMLYQRYRSCVTAEYRFPMFRIERGISTWPFYLRSIHGAVFWDAGAQGSTVAQLSRGRTWSSTGAELRSDWLFSYALPLRGTIGYARTIVRPWRQSVYLSMVIEL